MPPLGGWRLRCPGDPRLPGHHHARSTGRRLHKTPVGMRNHPRVGDLAWRSPGTPGRRRVGEGSPLTLAGAPSAVPTARVGTVAQGRPAGHGVSQRGACREVPWRPPTSPAYAGSGPRRPPQGTKWGDGRAAPRSQFREFRGALRSVAGSATDLATLGRSQRRRGETVPNPPARVDAHCAEAEGLVCRPGMIPAWSPSVAIDGKVPLTWANVIFVGGYWWPEVKIVGTAWAQ